MCNVEKKFVNRTKGGETISQSVTREKIEEAKKKSLQIVENLLEYSVSEELLTSVCNSISQDDYLDVIEERNILLLCGYPLCPKEVKPVKQKYHISVKTNKVYDITERKCFCSNTCYKASNFLKAQLSTSPIWLKEKNANEQPIKLLSTTKNVGSSGEEIDFGPQRMTTDDVEWTPDKSNGNSENIYTPYMSGDLDACAAEFKNLKISERHVYSINADTLESTLLMSEGHSKTDGVDDDSAMQCNDSHGCLADEQHGIGNGILLSEVPSEQLAYLDSNDDEEEHDEMLLGYKKYESLISDDKFMPVIRKENVRKTLLIDPIGNPDDVMKSPLPTPKAINSVDLIQNSLISWFTIETYAIIFGESKCESLRNEILQNEGTICTNETQTNVQKLDALKESYAQMCLKLDKEEAIELNHDSIENDDKDNLYHDKVQEERLPESKEALDQLKASMFYKGKMGIPETAPPSNKKKSGKKCKPPRGKSSKGDSSRKNPIKTRETEPVTASTSREDNVLPVVESLSQNAMRRQIVISNLKIVYMNMLPLVGLHYGDISEDLRVLVSTFSLSSTNISLKPSQWKAVAIVLFRILEKKIPAEKARSQEMCQQLLQMKLTSLEITLDQIDGLISTVTDDSHFRKLLLGY